MTNVHLPLAFPLAWPEDWERTPAKQRAPSRYSMPVGRAVEVLSRDLESWASVKKRMLSSSPRHYRGMFVLSTNIPARQDGRGPLASATVVGGDPGVAVWWIARESQEDELRVVACDTWQTVAENIRACSVVVSSLCAIDRAKASEMLRRAGWGLKGGLPALITPPPEEAPKRASKRATKRPWRRTPEWFEDRLDLPYPFTRSEVLRAYRARVREEHPDLGGDHEAFLELERARDAALCVCDD